MIKITYCCTLERAPRSSIHTRRVIIQRRAFLVFRFSLFHSILLEGAARRGAVLSKKKGKKKGKKRKTLQNEYLVAKIGFDTADNEPSKVVLIFWTDPKSNFKILYTEVLISNPATYLQRKQ